VAVRLSQMAEGPAVQQTSSEKLVGLVQEQQKAEPAVQAKVALRMLNSCRVPPQPLGLSILQEAVVLAHLLAFSSFPDLSLFFITSVSLIYPYSFVTLKVLHDNSTV
jgi:hypothetical protein